MEKLRSWILMGACVAFIACGSDDDNPPPMADTAGAPADASEECIPGTPEFTVGMFGLTKGDPTGRFSVRIVDANFQPPFKGFNNWVIQISDTGGNPMPQASLTWACAWMPAHGHGSNPRAVMKMDGGQFKLVEQNFSMNGGWLVRFWIDPDGKAQNYLPGTVSGARSTSACTPTSPGAVGQNMNIEFTVCVPRERGST